MTSVRPGGVVMHIGLMDNDGGFDAVKMTLQEAMAIRAYTYTPVDLRVTVGKLYGGAFVDLIRLEQRSREEGSRALEGLLHARTATRKIVLRP